MENRITTINDLPDDVIKIILRRLIVNVNMQLYFCINKRFTNILNCMSKRYNYCDYVSCSICKQPNFSRPTNTVGINKEYNTAILFDNICNYCFLKSSTQQCSTCKIKYIDTYYLTNNCVNCIRENRKKELIVLDNFTDEFSQNFYKLKCFYCKCKIFGPDIKLKYNITCKRCYDNIKTDYSIVLSKGFPYEINTYCPKKLKL